MGVNKAPKKEYRKKFFSSKFVLDWKIYLESKIYLIMRPDTVPITIVSKIFLNNSWAIIWDAKFVIEAIKIKSIYRNKIFISDVLYFIISNYVN